MSQVTITLILAFLAAALLEILIVPVEQRIFDRKRWSLRSPRERYGILVYLLLALGAAVSIIVDFMR